MTLERAGRSRRHEDDRPMKNSFTILIGGLIAAALLSYMFLYQVRYDQVAVRTTFDKADAGSVQDTPGLKWRLPWPIHKVTHYSKRLQLLEDKIEELQTADGKSVIVRTYLTWRIENPLDFYVTLKDPSEAAQGTASAGAGLTRRSHRSRRTEDEEGEARVDEQDDVGHDELGGLRRAPPAPEARRRNGSPFISRTGEGDRFPPPQQQQLPLLLSEQAVRCDARQSAGTSVVGGSRTHARQSARTFAMNR